jgi:hypothetical protein
MRDLDRLNTCSGGFRNAVGAGAGIFRMKLSWTEPASAVEFSNADLVDRIAANKKDSIGVFP